MDDLRPVRRPEALEELADDRRRLFGREATARSNALIQRRPVEVLEHHEARAVRELAQVEHLDDVLRSDAPGRLRLALEAQEGVGLFGDLRVEQLDGDTPVDPRVLRLVDRAHRALTKEADDAVLVSVDLPGGELHDERDTVSRPRSGQRGIREVDQATATG